RGAAAQRRQPRLRQPGAALHRHEDVHHHQSGPGPDHRPGRAGARRLPYVGAVRGVGFDPDGNLALGQQITSSSQALSWLGPANLIDGDPGTYFESANNAFPQTVTLDLGAERSVDRLVVRLPANWGG